MAKNMARRFVAAAAGLVVTAGVAGAQEVHWETGQPLAVGQRATLELRFEDAKPRGAVPLPEIDGLSVLGNPGRSSRIQTTQSGYGSVETKTTVTLAYPVRPTLEGRIEIPSFDIATDHGRMRVPAASLNVGRPKLARAEGGEITLDEVVSAHLLPGDRHPYAGEVFDLDFVVAIGEGRRGELLGSPVSNDPKLLAEEWGEGRSVQFAGRPGIHYRTRAMLSEPGPAILAPVEQEVAIETGRSRRDPFGDPFDAFFGSGGSPFSSVFDRRQKARVVVAAEPVGLEVEALPSPAPEGFSGAVGQFELKSRVIPKAPRAGEPVTWTLSLEGRGNWPSGVALPGRSISSDMRTLQPHLEREFERGERFAGRLVEDLVLIPEAAGLHILDPVRFVYFDPSTGRYEESVVQPAPLQVAAGVVPAQRVSPATPTVPGPIEPETRTGLEGQVQETVAALPADVRTGHGNAQSPMSTRALGAAAAVPVAGFLAYALLLGCRRARETDPRRTRREAFDAMQEAVDSLRSAGGREDYVDGLRAWQDASARFLDLDRAAPSIAELRRVDSSVRQDLAPALLGEWISVWRDSDGVLYGDDMRLASNWCDRAAGLVAQLERPSFNPLRAVLPRNWAALAQAAAVAGLFVVVGAPVRAEGVDDYRAGEFAAAREDWRERVAAQPSDWVAHYNLGLAEAQLEDSGRAFAHTTAAFLAAPRDERVRWNLALFGEGLAPEGQVDPVLDRVAFGDGIRTLARQASPWEWQVAAIAGVGSFVLGCALVLRRRHAGDTASSWPGRSFVAVGFASAGLSLMALHQYGDLAEYNGAVVSDAAVLRSIPTDAEVSQAQRPLAEGTFVLQGREFLGWVQVELSDGETGWLRSGQVVPLYGAPEA